MPVDPQLQGAPSRIRTRAVAAGAGAGAASRHAPAALVEAVGALAEAAGTRVLLSGERVTSAAAAKRLLAGEAETEALADKVQRVVVLAAPVVRMVARGAKVAKVAKVPWVIVASSSVAVGVAVRAGVRELQLLSSLVAHRLEQAGVPADPALVKKVAV